MARRVIDVLLSLLLLAAPAAAQVRETIEVQILEIEASVVDRKGNPVEGLKKEDFEVRIGRKTVPVENFFAVRNGVIVNDDAAPQKPVAPETSIATSLVIFIDELHLSPRGRARSFEALKRYVSANVGPNASAALVRYNRHFDLRVLPTEKPGYILAELDKIEKQPTVDDARTERRRLIEMMDEILNPPKNSIHGMQEQRSPAAHMSGTGESFGLTPEMLFGRIELFAERQSGEVERTLKAMEDAIEFASALAGRKVLLYVSDGLQQHPALELFEYWEAASRSRSDVEEDEQGQSRAVSTTNAGITQAMRFDRTRDFQRVVQAAQKGDVSIYAFDAGGHRFSEVTGPEVRGARHSLNMTSITSNARNGMQYVAGETGGLYIANDNDIDRVLARMSEQFTTYYSLAVRPHRGDIDVRIRKRPDLRVHAARRRAPRTREDRLDQNVRTRLYTRQVENPLNAAFQLGTPARLDGACVVPLRIGVPLPQLPAELTPQYVEVRMVMLNEHHDESAVQNITVPFVSGRAVHSMMLRVRPQKHVFSVAILNPVSGESSFLQGEIDATVCR